MELPVVPLRAVAALFLERQHLDRPRGRRLGAKSLTRFVEEVGGLQLDSINVVERAHYLTVWSRFDRYDKRALDRLAYRRRLLFEYWAHAACLISTRDFPAWRRAMLDFTHRNRSWSKWLGKYGRMLREVEAQLTERGPLGNSDFGARRVPGRSRSEKSAGWWSWKPATHALDYLWMSGRTTVHSRVHFQKRFDLIERVLPEALALTPPDAEGFRRWHLERSLRAMGAATEVDLGMYLTFPRVVTGGRRRELAAATRDGRVVEITVTASNGRGAAGAAGRARPPRWFALAADMPALARAGRRRIASRGTTLLAPFDSFLWHRERTRRLFGFDYTIEVYTPGHKRRHGYYSLPLLHEGQLIGRVDPKTHREDRVLELKHVHFEPWFADGGPPPAASWGEVEHERAFAGLGEALRSLAGFVGADRVTVGRVTPARLAASVRAALAG